MKALQMFDYVALWYARIFVSVLLILACLENWPPSAHLVTVINTHIPLAKTAPPYFLIGVFFWIICLENLNHKIARFCLALSSGFYFAFYLFVLLALLTIGPVTIFDFARKNGLDSYLPVALGVLYLEALLLPFVAGYGSVLWVSLRPPQNFKGVLAQYLNKLISLPKFSDGHRPPLH
ncbi:MAG: hypothetical protein LV481_00510 [Methylacidiphilales bacterium]|nr:hypothetical protein [Candidatus Methylacidiphilales bacterium]